MSYPFLHFGGVNDPDRKSLSKFLRTLLYWLPAQRREQPALTNE
jgi:hypothetical protein